MCDRTTTSASASASSSACSDCCRCNVLLCPVVVLRDGQGPPVRAVPPVPL